MSIPSHFRVLAVPLALLALGILAAPGRADEIRLKDGKKLYGVIVAYEDNMFKVKTDYGYVLVEKDKIAQIIPSTPAEAAPPKQPAAKPAADASPKAEPAAAKSKEPPARVTNANAKSSGPIINNLAVRPEIPVSSNKLDAQPPAIKTSNAAPKTALAAVAAPPSPPKEEPPVIREEILGNLYINHEFGFRIFKAPSWQLIDGAGQTLPNAIMAMGTSNESTLLVVAQEKTKTPLDVSAKTVEERLHQIYENYRLISERKTVVGGQAAIEYRYRGVADGHDWSGTLAVVSHGGEIFTVLGMTFADTDLIQIQENVIARAIASLDFSTK
ncbi:MAG TPA: hypothetical protein VFB10_05935 [Candidatus Dormibacteraeota bacterium]|nr:hypothetical protein [Candidatus Dormibacteraeota bacterium]